MNIQSNSKIKTIRQGDLNWTIVDDFTFANRAGLEINDNCPQNIAEMVILAYKRGWISPVAYVTERELIFMGLTRE